MTQDLKKMTLDYLEAVTKKDFPRLEQLLAPDLKFVGPVMTRTTVQDYLAALTRLSAIHVASTPRRVFVDGNEACVIYDFVTDTPAGSVPVIEWLRFEKGRIRAINLYYDQLPWNGVLDEMKRRSTERMA
jgi:ketosteroid isomerase-like protein